MTEFLLLIPGLGVLVSACVNIFKTVGLVGEGQGGNVVKVVNALLYLLFIGLPVFGVNMDWVGINVNFETAGDFLTIISMFFISVGSSDLFHKLFRGTPVIGKSFSLNK